MRPPTMIMLIPVFLRTRQGNIAYARTILPRDSKNIASDVTKGYKVNKSREV